MLLEVYICNFLDPYCFHRRVQNPVSTANGHLLNRKATVPINLPHSLELGSWQSRMWGPAGDGVPSDVITSAVVRAWSVMRSQVYAADVYELSGYRNAHQCLYTSNVGKSPLHPLARIRILPSPIGTRIVQPDIEPFVRRAASP